MTPAAAIGPSLPTPPQGAQATELRAFVDRRIRYESLMKMRRDSDNTKYALYRQADQWLQRSGGSTDPSQAAFWSRIEVSADEDDAIPMPVQPEIVVHLQNESARLGKPEYKPYVRPEGEDPTAEDREGAQLAQRALWHRLRAMRWPDLQAEGLMQMPLWGQWITCSEYVEDWLHPVRVPVLTALSCQNHPAAMKDAAEPATAGEGEPEEATEEAQPQTEMLGTPEEDDIPQFQEGGQEATPEPQAAPCGFVSASSQVTPEIAQGLPPGSLTQMDGGALHLYGCPDCGAPLTKYLPTMAEATGGKDAFGRPLGSDAPGGDWFMRNVSPYDYFPPAQGIGMTWQEQPYWLEVRPVHLSYVGRAFRNGDEVKAETPSAIAQWHPLTGERAVMAAGKYGDLVFEDFVRLKCYHEQPTRKYPNGRSIVLAQDTVLLDGDLMMLSRVQPGQRYLRASYDCAVWEPLPDQIWGLSLAKLLISLQDGVNEVLSMEEDRRTRMGIVGWVASRAMNLDVSGFTSGGGAGKRYEYDSDPLRPNAEPHMSEGASMPEAPGLVGMKVEAMGRISGMSQVEGDGPPPGMTAARAMEFLAEKSAERRAPRIRRIREMLERQYSHGLTVMYHRYLDDRNLDYEDDDKRWKTRAFKGTSLRGQTRVRIDVEPDHDTKLAEKQQIQDLMGSGFFGPPGQLDPQTREMIADKLEVQNIGSDMGLQREGASREFCDFRDLGEAPVVDQALDDHQAHVNQHGHDMHSDWWRDLEEKAAWQHVMPILDGWEQMVPLWEQQQQAMWPPQPVPGEPMPFLPALEFRLFGTMLMVLQLRGFDVKAMTPERGNALKGLLRFRAHFQAHRDYAQQEQMQAAGGAPVLAAPESENATAAGTVATNAAPPEALQMAQGPDAMPLGPR